MGVMVNRGSMLGMLLSLELIQVGALCGIVEAGRGAGSEVTLWVVVVMTGSSGEAALGLSLMAGYYRERGTIGVRSMSVLKG